MTLEKGTTTETKEIREISNAKDQEALISTEAEVEAEAEATRKGESTELEAPRTQVIADLYQQHNTIILSTDLLPITGQFLLSFNFCRLLYRVSSRLSNLLRTFDHLAILLYLFLTLFHLRRTLHIFCHLQKSVFLRRPFYLLLILPHRLFLLTSISFQFLQQNCHLRIFLKTMNYPTGPVFPSHVFCYPRTIYIILLLYPSYLLPSDRFSMAFPWRKSSTHSPS